MYILWHHSVVAGCYVPMQDRQPHHKMDKMHKNEEIALSFRNP